MCRSKCFKARTFVLGKASFCEEFLFSLPPYWGSGINQGIDNGYYLLSSLVPLHVKREPDPGFISNLRMHTQIPNTLSPFQSCPVLLALALALALLSSSLSKRRKETVEFSNPSGVRGGVDVG